MTLPYAPDDDHAADPVINTALRTRHVPTWRLLTSPDYVLQTERVLRNTLDQLKVSVGRRQADLDRLRDQRARQEITHEQFDAGKRAWHDWLGRTEYFEATVREYLRLVADMARPVRGDVIRDELIETLKAIAGAVHRHQTTTLLDGVEPTPADRALWARLSVLSVRLDEVAEPVSLIDLARPSKPEADTIAPAKPPLSEITIEIMRLLLDLTADTNSVPRTQLTEEWSKRASYLDERDREKRKGKGTRSAQVLNQFLRAAERNGTVQRTHQGEIQMVDVLDRDRLRQLVHPD